MNVLKRWFCKPEQVAPIMATPATDFRIILPSGFPNSVLLTPHDTLTVTFPKKPDSSMYGDITARVLQATRIGPDTLLVLRFTGGVLTLEKALESDAWRG